MPRLGSATSHFRIPVLMLALSLPAIGWANSNQLIVGTWKLVRVTLGSVEDSSPRGIPAVKEHYSHDGKLYVLEDSGKMGPDTAAVDYRLDGNLRTVVLADGSEYRAEVAFPDSNSLVLTQEAGDVWTYARMPGEDAADQAIEPLSVETIRTVADGTAIKHDTSDYSALPISQRLVGVWETIGHYNVSQGEPPPYGYLNDIWLLNGTQLTFRLRYAEDEEIPPIGYTLTDSILTIGTDEDQRVSSEVSFNSWGHLLLTSEGETLALKLISKDVSKGFPDWPVVITLMTFKDNN